MCIEKKIHLMKKKILIILKDNWVVGHLSSGLFSSGLLSSGHLSSGHLSNRHLSNWSIIGTTFSIQMIIVYIFSVQIYGLILLHKKNSKKDRGGWKGCCLFLEINSAALSQATLSINTQMFVWNRNEDIYRDNLKNN